MLYRSLLRPLLFRLPPETAHELALHSLSLAPKLTKTLLGDRYKRSPFGKLRRFGLTFSNPVGLAAGFDKDGVALESLAELGFGFIEAGTVTYHPQPGNQRPRLFRLPLDKALINRAGFNNEGAIAFAKRVRSNRPEYPIADYIAVNVSSPNTPRLRELQQAEQLEALLRALQTRNGELAEQPAGRGVLPLLVKLSPDLDHDELRDVVAVALRNKVAGLIATNTTTARAPLKTTGEEVQACGEGGLSGAPLRRRSREMIATLYNMTQGSMPLVGVGGIFTAEDAWEMISAGASLMQIYTGFIYKGPSIVKEINEGLRRIIAGKGFVSLDEAVGSRAKDFAAG